MQSEVNVVTNLAAEGSKVNEMMKFLYYLYISKGTSYFCSVKD